MPDSLVVLESALQRIARMAGERSLLVSMLSQTVMRIGPFSHQEPKYVNSIARLETDLHQYSGLKEVDEDYQLFFKVGVLAREYGTKKDNVRELLVRSLHRQHRTVACVYVVKDLGGLDIGLLELDAGQTGGFIDMLGIAVNDGAQPVFLAWEDVGVTTTSIGPETYLHQKSEWEGRLHKAWNAYLERLR